MHKVIISHWATLVGEAAIVIIEERICGSCFKSTIAVHPAFDVFNYQANSPVTETGKGQILRAKQQLVLGQVLC